MSNMEKHLFNLKFAAKELQRNSRKCDKEEKSEKTKVKQAIQKGNMEAARIHAENAIRQKHQSINFLRMSARISALMDKFEKQFETLDVQTAQMEDTMSSTTTLTTPQVTLPVISQEGNTPEPFLDLNLELPAGQTSSLASSVASAEQVRYPSRAGRYEQKYLSQYTFENLR
uniref:Charged multivesicular body protein 1b-1-like n=1 Tax=Pundamilia nyererei TaxID=303518 RepID=A0A3B4EQT7_9CICH